MPLNGRRRPRELCAGQVVLLSAGALAVLAGTVVWRRRAATA
jgi:hypothetical protein